MDINEKTHANQDDQGDESSGASVARPSGNHSQKGVTKPEAAKPEEAARPGQLPDPNTEMVGGPSSPGKRVESTPDRQRDSEAKV